MEVDLPTLTTARLELRAARESDAAPYFAFDQRCAVVPEAVRFLLHPLSKNVDEVRVRLARGGGPFSPERTVFCWLVREKGRDDVVGYVAFVRWDHEASCTEVAYGVDPACWGKGYAVEACARMLDFAWENLALHRAEARIDPNNTASIRAAEKLGFALEGTLRENVFSGGRYFDTAIYAKLRPRPA